MRKLLAAATFVALAFGSTGAYAATSTATLSISATITSSCTFANPTQSIDISTAAATSTATSTPETIGITCTAGNFVSIAASKSFAQPNCGIGTRSLSGGGAFAMSYDLKIGSSSWCDGSGGTVALTTTGTGALQSLPYAITMPGYATDIANFNKPNPYSPGTYTDSITLTATF